MPDSAQGRVSTLPRPAVLPAASSLSIY